MNSVTISDVILDSIEDIVNGTVSKLQYDKTIKGIITSIDNESIGQYSIKYQNAEFTAYSTDSKRLYEVGEYVFVQIPNGDFTEIKHIIGRVNKVTDIDFGTEGEAGRQVINYLTDNLYDGNGVAFNSYGGNQQIGLIVNGSNVNWDMVPLYKDEATHLTLSMDIRTLLSEEQRLVHGNYGLRLIVEYENSNSVSDTTTTTLYQWDVSNYSGQPYNYANPSPQLISFPIDASRIKSIKSLEAFCEDFLTGEQTTYDIYLNDIGIYLTSMYNDSQLVGNFIRLETPKGTIFQVGSDSSIDKYVKVEFLSDGRIIEWDSLNDVSFYWFMEDNLVDGRLIPILNENDEPILDENGDQTYEDNGYMPEGGLGWRRLNRIVNGVVVADEPTLHLTTNEINVYRTRIKCVVKIKNATYSAIKTYYNLNKQPIKIISSRGTKFNISTMTTDLTCLIGSSETPNYEFNYVWTKQIDGRQAQFIEEVTGPVLEGIVVAEALNNIVFTVDVFDNDIPLGNATITLINNSDNFESTYSLILYNASKIYQYNEYGIAPNSSSIEPDRRISLLPITFDVVDDLGNIIEMDDSTKEHECTIRWEVPNPEMTLLQFVEPVVEEDGKFYIDDVASLEYGLSQTWNNNKSLYDIIVTVSYQGYNLTQTTNIRCIKSGDVGTNGSDYVATIRPTDYGKGIDEIYFHNGSLYGIKRQYGETVGIVDVVNDEAYFNKPLQFQFWNGGELMNGTYDDNWEVKRYVKNYSTITRTVSIGAPDSIGRTDLIRTLYSDDSLSKKDKSNIISYKYRPTGSAKTYSAYYPLTLVRNKTSDGRTAVIDGGFKIATYENDGTRAKYNNSPFKLRVWYNGHEIDVVETDIVWDCSWKTSNNNPISYPDPTDKTTVKITPPREFDAIEHSDAWISCKINDSFWVVISVYMYANAYSMPDINEWDGTVLQLKEGENYLLAQQGGFGKKESDNTFTGVVVGKSYSSNNYKQGIMGYYHGEETFFVDADSGKATFGRSGRSQIIIEPKASGTDDSAYLQSGNYSSSGGMRIDLAKPEIRWGNGKFVVNEDGSFHVGGTGLSDKRIDYNSNGTLSVKGTITATDGSIAGWTIDSSKLYNKDNSKIYLKSNGDARLGIFFVNTSNTTTVSNAFTNDSRIAFGITSDSSIDTWPYESQKSSYPFFVTHNGYLYAGNAHVEGNITATSGRIGNWYISEGLKAATIVSPNGSWGYDKNKPCEIDPSSGIKFYNLTIAGRNKYDTSSDFSILSIVENRSISSSPEVFSISNAGVLRARSGYFGGWGYTGARGWSLDYQGTFKSYKQGGNIPLGAVTYTMEPNGHFNLGSLETYGDGSFDMFVPKSLSPSSPAISDNTTRSEWYNIIKFDSSSTQGYRLWFANTRVFFTRDCIFGSAHNIMDPNTSSGSGSLMNFGSTSLTGNCTIGGNKYSFTYYPGATLAIKASSITTDSFVNNNNTETSDKKLKQNIKKIDNIQDFYLNLNPVSYKLKPKLPDPNGGNTTHYGLIAQEVADLYIQKDMNWADYSLLQYCKNNYNKHDEKDSFNAIVNEYIDGAPGYFNIKYEELHAFHIKMIQDLYQQVQSLQQQINQLKGEN